VNTHLSTRRHWLVEAAMECGFPSADRADISLDEPASEAWEQVARACDVVPEVLAEQLAAYLRLPVAELESVKPHVLKLLPEKLSRRMGILPLREDDRCIVVATCDPMNVSLERDLTFVCGREVKFELAPPAAIAEALAAHYGAPEGAEAMRLEDDLTRAVEVLEDSGPELVDASEVESAPIIKLTNFILSEAVKQRASDIHLEPGRGQGTVRIRVDGVMRTLLRLPMAAINRVTTRIKIMGKLDIADRLRPQDGRARIQVDAQPMELRISTVPTREAEKCVVRLLDHGTAPTLQDLGIPALEYARIEKLLSNRNGIVVVTGPTGSGKTTTLYAAIRQLATGEINIMTVENPVEYEIAGITQIQVEPKQRVTFPSALRAILRQDPDVILIGEIRDAETAAIALQASLTGHLVLATMHTNDAAGAIERLLDLGVDRTGVAASLRGVIAQRLVRKLCERCAEPVGDVLKPEEERAAARLGTRPVRRAVGCAACGRSGYHGRMALLEVMLVTPSLASRVSGARPSADMTQIASSGGMRSLLANGIARVESGETTLEEVVRVVGSDVGELALAEAVPVTGPTPPRKVLIIDDDKVQRMAARRVLEAGGFEVDEAPDGMKGLVKLRRGVPYALVLLDHSMPDMDGLEVLQEIRGDSGLRALPVVVATAREDDGLEARLINEGADDYIVKPLVPARFMARVNAVLRRART
jgi:type IV pilus assembly protein PilB